MTPMWSTDRVEGAVRLRDDAPLVLQDSLESLAAWPAGGGAAGAGQAAETVRSGRMHRGRRRARVALAEARVEEARRAGRFDMTLAGGYDRMTFDFAQRGFDAAGRLAPIEGIFHSMTVGAMLTLPLRNGTRGRDRTGRTEAASRKSWQRVTGRAGRSWTQRWCGIARACSSARWIRGVRRASMSRRGRMWTSVLEA